MHEVVQGRCTSIRVNVCVSHVCEHVGVCVCVNLGPIDRNVLKKSTQTSTRPSVQGAIFYTKDSFEERKEKGRKKETDFKCAPKKSRLKAPLFPPFSLAPFFAAIERSRMIVGCNRGERDGGY